MTSLGQHDQRTSGFCAWCGAARSGKAPFCATCGRAHALSEGTVAAGAGDDTVVLAVDEPATADTQEHVWPWQCVDEPGTSLRDPMGRRSTLPADKAPGPRAKTSWLRSRWVMLTTAAAVALLVAWVAMAGVGYLRDRPVHTALDTATAAYRPVIGQLTQADDLLALQAAGQQAERALPTLRQQHVDLQERSGDLADGAFGVVGAQVAVAEAVESLSELDERSLAGWGELHTALARSVQRETRARMVLVAHDPETAAALPDTRAALTHAEQLVGRKVAGSASDATSGLLGQLADARRTADVRGVAADAEATAETLAAARTGVDGNSPDGRRLTAAIDVLTELMALSALDGDSLEVWSTVQAPLESALTVWAQGETGFATSHENEGTVEALDALVNRAEEKLAEWEADYNAAVEDRAEDLDALESYADSMRAELEVYDGLRAETSEFVDRIDTVTYREAYNELSEGAQDRSEVWDAMAALEVPGEVRSAHDDLTEIVDDAVDAMYAAYDGVYDSEWCTTSCFYNMTPAWREFSSESDRITGEFETATGAWEAAVAAAERSVEGRELPAEPRV